jgi:hypothetical protein
VGGAARIALLVGESIPIVVDAVQAVELVGEVARASATRIVGVVGLVVTVVIDTVVTDSGGTGDEDERRCCRT